MSIKELKASLLNGYSFQAQHNSFAAGQQARKVRVLENLDKLEALQKAQKAMNEQPLPPSHPY